MNNSAAHKATAAGMPWLKSYPPGIDWRLNVEPQPLFAMLDRTAAKYPDAVAIVFAGQSYTYAELLAIVDRAAAGLQALGVGKGIKVGLFMPNSVYAVALYYATLKAGGTVVNYNPVYAERDLVYQAEDSETDILVTLDQPSLMEKVGVLLEKTRVRRIIVCPAQEDMRASGKTQALDENYTWFCDLLTGADKPAAVDVDFENDIAVLQYTGGTTGTSKGAVLTHKNLVMNTLQTSKWHQAGKDGEGVLIAALPLFHVFAMTVLMNMSILRGFKLFLLPQFDLREMLSLVHNEKPTYLHGVPTIFMAIANYDKVGDYDFSSVEACVAGGAPLPAEVKSLFEKRTGVRCLVEGYGLTEASPLVTLNPMVANTRSGSIGVPVPETVVDIISIDDGVTVVPVGERGEICVSGPQVMKGYYNKAEETGRVLKNGRLHTGDVGYMDEDGFIYIVDRIKDLIIVSGYNVYPRHIEEAVYSHPEVKECIVAGVPDKMRGEVPYAWIKTVDGSALDAGKMRAFLDDKLSPIEMPRKIIICDEPLPKTAVGKLSKKDLLAREGFAK